MLSRASSVQNMTIPALSQTVDQHNMRTAHQRTRVSETTNPSETTMTIQSARDKHRMIPDSSTGDWRAHTGPLHRRLNTCPNTYRTPMQEWIPYAPHILHTPALELPTTHLQTSDHELHYSLPTPCSIHGVHLLKRSCTHPTPLTCYDLITCARGSSNIHPRPP